MQYKSQEQNICNEQDQGTTNIYTSSKTSSLADMYNMKMSKKKVLVYMASPRPITLSKHYIFLSLHPLVLLRWMID